MNTNEINLHGFPEIFQHGFIPAVRVCDYHPVDGMAVTLGIIQEPDDRIGIVEIPGDQTQSDLAARLESHGASLLRSCIDPR
jgi:hypothetical protein